MALENLLSCDRAAHFKSALSNRLHWNSREVVHQANLFLQEGFGLCDSREHAVKRAIDSTRFGFRPAAGKMSFPAS